MICVVLFLILVTLVVLYLVQEVRFNNEIQNIPGPPLVPFFGSETVIDSYAKDVLINVKKLIKEYGSVVRLCVGSKVLILLTEPKYIELLQSSEINCKGDSHELVLITGWIKDRIGPLFTKFENAFKRKLRLSNSLVVDSEFLRYFNKKRFSGTDCHTSHFNKTELEWRFDFETNEALADLIREETVKTDPVLRFVVFSVLVILAGRPGLQREIFDEIDGDVDFQGVEKAEKMDRVLKEVIWPYGGLSFIVRTLAKKVKFGNISVPAGVNVLILTNNDALTNPKESSVKFEDSKSNSCIGQKNVMLRAKVKLAKIILKFEVIPGREENGLPFTLKLRDNKCGDILNEH